MKSTLLWLVVLPVISCHVAAAAGSSKCSGETPTCEQVNSRHKRRLSAARHIIHSYLSDQPTTMHMDAARDEVRLLLDGTFSSEELEQVLADAMADTEDHKPGAKFGDRFIRGLEDTIADRDCMSREFDVASKDFDAEKATSVFRKCKLLVLRNLFDLDFLNEFKANVTDYMTGLDSGRISRKGRTSNGESFHLSSRGPKRWEVIFPKQLANKELVTNEILMEILLDKRILGSGMVLHSFGAAVSESGADAQKWHEDDLFLFEESGLPVSGIGGHDLPAYAVTVMVPMLNMTSDHGPTEFCMGSSNLNGMGDYDDVFIKNESLVEEGSVLDVYVEYGEDGYACPPQMWRSPQKLNFGDVLLFDYQLRHRGGRNTSPDLRALAFMTFSREWYKDRNFREESGNDLYKYVAASGRYAEPKQMEPCGENCQTVELENIRNFLNPDAWTSDNDDDEDGEEEVFVVSNKDVDIDNLQLFVNDRSEGQLEPGGSIEVYAQRGDHVHVRGGDKELLKSWTVVSYQRQLMISNDNIGASSS